MKIVFIEWLDATQVSTRKWEDADQLETEGCHLYSAGVLVKEDEKGYFLACDVDPLDLNRVRCVSFIPRAMVRKIKTFNAGPK